MAVRLPTCASVHVNPTQAEMRALVLGEMPRITETEFGNLSYEAEVTARLKNSTFFVADTENHQNRMSSIHAARWAELQDEYIADKDMILLTGYIGPDAGFQTGCELFIESSNANIPAMQQQLFFPADGNWEREFTVIYTPGLSAPGMPDDRLIMVDHKGEVVDGDEILYIIARSRLAEDASPSAVVGTLMSNLGLEVALKRDGIDFKRANVGDRYVMEVLKQEDWKNLWGYQSCFSSCVDCTSH